MSKLSTFQHIRNATGKIIYNGLSILIDPILCPKGTYPGFDAADSVERKKMRNPLVELPTTVEDILKDLEAIILTHTHRRTCSKINTKIHSNFCSTCW